MKPIALVVVVLLALVAPVLAAPVLAAPLAQGGSHPALSMSGSCASYSSSTGELSMIGAGCIGDDWGVNGGVAGGYTAGDLGVYATTGIGDQGYWFIGLADHSLHHYSDGGQVSIMACDCNGGHAIQKNVNGSLTAIGTYSAGDRLGVAFLGGDVIWTQNGSVLATASGAAMIGDVYVFVDLNNQHNTTVMHDLTVEAAAVATNTATRTPTITLTRTPTNTPVATATNTPAPTNTPNTGGSMGTNLLSGRTGCIMTGGYPPDPGSVAINSDNCYGLLNTATDGSLNEVCVPPVIWYDLGGYYLITELNAFLEGTDHGAGGGLVWAYYTFDGWHQMGATISQQTLDAWHSSGADTPSVRYIGVNNPGPNTTYWCPNELEAAGEAADPPPTWTPTPTVTPTVTPFPTHTPFPPTATALYSSTPTPGNAATATAQAAGTATYPPGVVDYCNSIAGGGDPQATYIACLTQTPPPADTPTATAVPPTSTSPAPPPGTCGDQHVRLYPQSIADIGQASSQSFENFDCVTVVGTGQWVSDAYLDDPPAEHSGSYTRYIGSSTGPFEEGPFLNRGNGTLWSYPYMAACRVNGTSGAPVSGNCGSLEIVAQRQILDVYWSDAEPGDAATATATAPAGTGTPTPAASGTPGLGGGCGGVGLVPCNVQWQTPMPVVIVTTGPLIVFPTALPTATMFGGGNAIATAVGATQGGDGGGLAYSSGGAGFHMDYPTTPYLPTHIINVLDWDYGCPIDIGAFKRHLSICIKYHEITELNLAMVAVPVWPFIAALLLLVVGWVMKA